MKRVFATMNGVEGANGVPGVSGGDVRLIKMIDMLADRMNFTLSTTEMGQKLVALYEATCDYHIIHTSGESGVRANLDRVFRSVCSVPGKQFDLAYSGGEHLYDVLPALRLKLLHGTPWLALVHWVEEYPWKDKRGGTPVLHRYLYWLNRVVAMTLIKLFADRVLAVSGSTRQKLVENRGFNPAKVSTVYCGLDMPFAKSVRESTEPKRYDAVFMKRLNYGKGVRDLIDIWARVVQARPDSRLLVMGSGPSEVVAEVEERIAFHGIQKNVELAGVVHDPEEKRRRLAQSRVFVLPSHEENWAIVIGEALAAGLPVIAYDLKEIRPLWGERVSWVPFGDVDEFARRVLSMLDTTVAPPLDEFLQMLDWEKIADNEHRHMQQVMDV